MKKSSKLKYLLFLFIIGGVALLYYAKTNTWFAQWYAITIYPTLSKIVGFLPSLAPFSVAEILIACLVLVAIIYVIKFIITIIRGNKSRLRTVVNFVVNPLLLASVIFFVYILNMGINYYRIPFAEAADIKVETATKEELAQLCTYLADTSNETRTFLQKDSKGVMKLAKGFSASVNEVTQSYNTLKKTYPMLISGSGSVKPMYFSEIFSYANITGVTFPFTIEGNVNTKIPQICIPFAIAHELTHVKGYMKEDEANFLAYLVCSTGKSVELTYSGAVMGFIYAGDVLNKIDSAKYTEIFRTLNDGVQKDIKEYYNYWKNYSGAISTAANTINDIYLKANNQKDGTASYGKMVDLMLAYYIKSTN